MGRTKTISDDKLREHARRVFVERGINASTKEIARRAGVSEGVIYQRYKTKADLFFAAMVLPPADLMRHVHARGAPARTRLMDITAEMVEYFRATLPVLLPVMSHPEFRFEEFAARHPDSPLDALRRDLVAFFAEEKRGGRIGPVDAGAAALAIFSVGLCVAFFEQMGAHGGRLPAEIVRRTADCLWEGLAPRIKKAGG
jgi:AcrR family transcriptional regulator